MQEFLAHQSERKWRHNETLVDYIYAKDALLEKAPFTIPQPDRISMIIGDITKEKWQIALATQNTNTVEELIDRATALDDIRSAKQEHKKHSPKSQNRSYPHDEQRRKYNHVTDNVGDITCWSCGNKGHASFMCSLPPPPRGSAISQPRNTSQQNQYTNSQTNAQIPSSSSSTSSNNRSVVETISLNSSNSRSNNNCNSTSGRSTTANRSNNNSINCIRTETNRRALIPVIINETEIQALCDPCADITVIQQSCVPNDIVINPWTDGQFQVVDHEKKPIGWISLNITVGNLEHMMPKIGVCTQLPFKLILGFDWQQQVQARCTYDPNGSLSNCVLLFLTLTVSQNEDAIDWAAKSTNLRPLIRILPETPRWLLTHRKFDELERVLLLAAKKNGKDMKQARVEISDFISYHSQKDHTEKVATIMNLLNSKMIKHTINIFFCWFINSYIYYALSWNTNDLAGDPYLNFFISGAVELPEVFVFIFLCRYIGNRLGLAIANVLSGICLIGMVCVPSDMVWLTLVLSMSGKFFCSGAFDTEYVYTPEIFPTVLRNVAVGSSSTVARIGALIAPFIHQLADVTYPWVPMAIPGGLSILSGLFVLLLPETKGKILPDTLEEGEKFVAKQKTANYLNSGDNTKKQEIELRKSMEGEI
ncbi:unnamed protein product [Larinioides sclopetarius]|uniref:Retropepsins domain-containing protein n=1 Tax=Larinioides sclopetarius TaxID=280406 RepID=A0AAV2AJP4_9ARAC